MLDKILKKKFKTECVKEFRFHPKRRWRADYALPEYRILIEVEGGIWVRGRHNQSVGFLKDMEKYNTATSMGYSILRITPQEVLSNKIIDLVEETIKNKK
jgi:very-short-patch-repair endonuclease